MFDRKSVCDSGPASTKYSKPSIVLLLRKSSYHLTTKLTLVAGLKLKGRYTFFGNKKFTN